MSWQWKQKPILNWRSRCSMCWWRWRRQGIENKMDRMFLVDSPNRLPFVLNEYFAKKHYRFARCKTISYGIDDDSIVQLDSHNCISIKRSYVITHLVRIRHVFQWHTMLPWVHWQTHSNHWRLWNGAIVQLDQLMAMLFDLRCMCTASFQDTEKRRTLPWRWDNALSKNIWLCHFLFK